MPKAEHILSTAEQLVTGARAEQHGNRRELHKKIAALWNVFLFPRLGERTIEPHEVALMMALLKVARANSGDHNPDDYVDGAGYAAIAGELVELD